MTKPRSRKGENYGKITPDKGTVFKAKVVGSRISGEQAERLSELAEESNMTESTYIRYIIQRAISEGLVFRIEPVAVIAK